MSATTPCYRHRRRSWIASCTDCTAWHLAEAVARRDHTTGALVAPFRITPRLASTTEWLDQSMRPAA